MIQPEEIIKKINEVIAKYVDTSAINLNKLIDESSVNQLNASNYYYYYYINFHYAHIFK